MKNNLKLILAAACLFATIGTQQMARAATFGWSGSGTGPGTGAATAWLTAGNWTNNLGTPTNIDIAHFGLGGTAAGIGFNFNAPPITTTNIGAITLGAGSTIDRTIGNSSTTVGIQTRMYHFGISGGLFSNTVAGRTLSFLPFASGGSGNGMTNVIMAAGNIEAVGNINFISQLTDDGVARNITKSGAGQLILSTNSAFLGTFTVNAGGITVRNSGSFGTGTKTISLANGTAGHTHMILDNTGTGADINFPSTLSFTTSHGAGTVTNNAGNNIIQGNFTMATGGGDTTIIANGGTLTLRGTIAPNTTLRNLRLGGTSTGTNTAAGPITGSGANFIGFVKQDSGTWNLTGTNTFNGNSTFNAGTLILGANGSISNSPTITVASGATFNVAAVGGGFALETNQTLNGAGSVIGNVTFKNGSTNAGSGLFVNSVTANSGSSIQPGGLFAPGTMVVSNTFTISGGSSLNFDLASIPIVNSGSNDLIVVNGNLNFTGPVPITLAFPLGQPQLGVPYTLFRYSGLLSGAGNLSLVGVSSPSATLDTSVPGLITVTFTAAAANNLVWTGNPSANNYDLATTTNWLNGIALSLFGQGDNVTFDDSSVNTTVNLVGNNLQPATVTVNAAANYALQGSGAIAGGSLTKSGSGTLTVNTANTYPGATLVSGGTLKTGNGAALGNAVGTTTISGGATLDVNGQNLGQEPVVVSGVGVGGAGAIVNSGAQQLNAIKFLTLAGDTTLGGVGRWDVRANSGNGALSSGGQSFRITKVGANMVGLVDTVVDPALGDIDVQAGTFTTESFTLLGDPTRTMTVWSNAIFRLWANSVPLNKVMVMSNTAKFFVENGTANAFNGTINLVEGTNFFDINVSSALSVTGNIAGAAALMKTNTGTLSLFGTNSYTGLTIISNGLLQGTTLSIPGAVTNNAGLVINQNFGGTLVGPVVGTGGTFIKRGTGRLTITTPMGITGTVTHEAGTIVLGADNVLGTGLQDWRGAGGLFPTFESSDASTRTITNSISISTDTRLGSAASGNLVFSGPINNGGAQKMLTVSNAVTTFSSGFNNLGVIVKAGPGQLALGGANNNAGLTISNGTVSLLAGGYFSNSPNVTIVSGAVLDVSAGSGSTFTNISGRTLIAGRTSGSGNDIVGSLQSTGTITLAAAAVPATLTVSGNVLIGGGTLNFDLGSSTTVGGGVSDLITNNGTLTLAGPITLALNAFNGSLANGTYRLMQSAGAIANTATFTVTGTNGWRQSATLAVGANEVTLIVAGTPIVGALTWLGTNAVTGWDLLTTNWWSGSITDRFFQADGALFDNSSTNTNVVVAVTVLPSAVIVTSSSNYAFSGAGKISGGAGYTKLGTGTNLMSLANDYIGQTLIDGGMYKMGNAAALGATNTPGLNANTVITGGSLDLNGNSVINESFTVQGAGLGGNGAMVNNGAAIVNGGPRARVTLIGDTTFGAPNRWDLQGGATLAGNGFKLTKVGGSEMFMSGLGETALGDIDVQQGFLTWGANSTAGDPTKNYNVANGASLNFFAPVVPLNKMFTFQNGSLVQNGSGTAILAGPVSLSGLVNFNLGQPMTVSNIISGSGLLAKNAAAVLTVLSNATYTGGTLVNGGTLQVGNGFVSGVIPGRITNNNATVEFAPAAPYPLLNDLVGPGGTVRKSGSNLLQLAGAGADQIADSMVLDVTGGVFDLNGRSEGVRGLTGNLGTFVTNSGGSTVSLVLTNPNASPHVYNGSIAGPITVVVRDSATRSGVLQSFSGTNAFTGGLVIDNGQLRSSGDWVLGAVPAGYDPANIIFRNNGAIQNNASTLFLHPNRGILLEGDVTFMAGFSAGNDIVVSGSISGPGRVLKGDGQRLILKNGNTFTGDTVFTNVAGVGQGTIRLDHSLALQNSTFEATGLGGNGTLDLNNMDVVIGMLKGSGATLANFNGRLTAGGNGQNGVFGSTLSGAGSLVKVGPGILSLTAANPYNGGTIVSNGTLLALGNLSGFGPLVVKSGAMFGSPAIVSGPVTVEAGGSVYPGASVGTLSVSNNLSINSGSLFYELASVNNTGGGINDLINVQSNLTLSGSTLVRFSFVNGAPALGVPYVLMTYAGALSGSAANLTANTRYTTTFDNSVAGQIRVTFTGAGGSNLVWSGSSTNNTWNLDTFTNFYNGLSLDTFKDADSVTFNDSGYAGAPVNMVGLLSPTVLTISAAQDYTFAGVGHLNMAGSLVKLGAGKLTLANTNDFIGSFNVGAGTLSVALEESLGLAPVAAINQIFLPGGTFQAAGTFTLNSNRRIVVGPTNTAGSGAIEVTGTNVLSYAGVIGNNQFGVGTLVKRGSGRLSLQNANIYSGGTILSKGTISLRNGNALGAFGSVTVGNAASGADDLTLLLETSAGNLTLNRDINVSSLGSGVVTLGSTPLPLAAGANDMRFNGNIALTNRDLVLRSGGGNSTFFSGDILGTGNLIITNGSLTGDVGGGQAGNRVIWDNLPKSFTGDITILGGTVTPIYTNFTVLQMNTANIIRDTANVTVQANAVFRLNADENINGLTGAGRVRGVVSLRTLGVGANNASSVFNGVMENDPVNGGSLALTKLGSGALTLNGTNSYTGGTIAGAGTLALGSNGSLSNSTSLIVSNGAIFDVSAVSGGYVLMGNQTLSGFGTVLGSTTLASNATVNPGLLNVVGSLAVTGNLGLNNSNRFNFDLGGVPAGPGNDQMLVTGDLNISGISYITVNAASPLAAGTYTLITCSGAKSSAGAAANFVLINNTASAMTLGENASAITLTVTTAGRSLVWAANFTNSLWDINTTTNWLNGGVLSGFLAGDAVLFDSTASNQTVTLNVTALASTVSLTGATNYNFTGSGRISGSASIVQNSASTNVMGLANDFSGSVTLNGGVLRANNAAALGNPVGATIINGGSLEVNSLNLGAEQFIVQGTGWQGQGAIINNFGAGQLNATRFVTLAGNTTFGGTTRWDIRANPTAFLSSGGQPYKLTKTNFNQVNIVDAVVDPALGDIEILGGILGFEVNSTAGDPSRGLFIGSGATLQFWELRPPFNKQIYMTNGARFNNGSGVNAIISPITLLGSNAFDVAGTSVALSNTVSGPGTLWKVGGGSTLILAGNNSYSGGTVLQTGTTIITGSEPNSGGYSNIATLQIGNNGSSGTIGGLITNNGSINLQRLDSSSFTAGVLGVGTINQASGSGPVTLNGNITNANLNVRSGNGSFLTLGSGNYSITNLTVGNTPSGWMNILPGATVGIPNTYYVGDASGGQTGVVVQTGGDVIVGNQFRLAHWPNNVSTYLLGGGSLSLTTVSATSPSGAGEQNGGFYIGIDGVGIFTQTGGALNVPGLVLDNRGASTLGIATNTYDLRGGTLTLGQWGFASPNTTYQINLGGGTVASSLNWTSTLNMRLTGTGGDVTFHPAGFNNFLFGVLSGPGGLNKAGAGSLILSNASTFTGNTLITGGTLALVGSGGVAGSANVMVGPGAVLDATLKGGGFGVPVTQTLGGNGTVLGPTFVFGTLAPGASIGTLTFGSALTMLAATTVMEIDRGAGQNADLIIAPAVDFDGTLVVTNTGGALVALDTFNLFDATTFTGVFDSIILPPLPGGLAWDLSRLYLDGTIRVVVPPVIVTPPTAQTGECGGGVTFTVVAAGTAPLSYQWRSNTVSIAGANGDSLTLNNLNTVSSGSFDVVVANTGGTNVSAAAALSVADTIAPSVTCPASIVAECTSSNGTPATFSATATDTCAGILTPVCVPASGSTFAIGTNVVTCTTTDAAGNTNACTFTVAVIDTTPPVISVCATNLSLPADPNCQVAVPDFTSQVVATDNCGAVTVTQNPVAGTLVGLGATNITLTASDAASNSVTCTLTLTVIDSTPPALTCPANISVQCDTNVPPANFAGGIVSDNCDLAPVVTHVSDVASGSCPKTIVRTYRATDAVGNTNDCAQTITVHDTTAPMLICPAPVSVQCPTNVPLPDVLLVTASDNCDSSPTVTYVGDVSTGVNPTIITRTYRATDVCGNTNDCAQIITIEDTTAPSITACALSSFIVGDTNGLAIVPDQRSQIIATDNCGVPIIIQVPAPGSMISTGVHVLTFTAIDSASNTSACTATLTIVAGALPPVILVQPQDATAECSSNATFTVSVDGTPPFAYQWFFGVSPMANATNDSLILSAVTAAQDGGYSVIITNDGGSITSRVARLTVVDTIAPSVTCPGPIHLKTTSTNGAVVSFAASASDGCTPSPALACLPAAGSLFPVGLTTVICTAVDSSGNSNSCSFAVTVLLASTASLLVNQPVPDIPSLGLASVLNVSSPIGSLSDVNVTLNISNGWNGDLFAYLVHESGYAVLLNRVGRTGSNPLGYSDAGLNVTLDDQATNDIHTYRLSLFGNHSTPLAGALTNSWQPDGRAEDPALVLDTTTRTDMLSAFNGMNPNGEWVLFVEDDATGDISTLVSWGLELCGTLGVSPTITAPPQNVAINCGSNAVFNVTATGTGPVGYHWLRNGLPIPGANATTYAINNAHPTDNATYSVIVSNAFGAVTASATLVVNEPNLPVILTQPQSVTNNVGTTVSLSVAASSCSALSYQWCFGLTPLAGETNPTLTILNVQLVNQGGYTVKVSNAGGTTTSAVAVVTVNRPPVAQNNGGATIQGQALMIQVGKLLANDTDPDGDPLTVISVTASTNGGMVALGGGKVTYMPVPAFVGTDRFSYTISDGRGGTATADVEVLVVSGSLPSLNQVSLIPTPNGFLIRFAGIPGELYRIQRAPSVTGPWTTIATQTAPLHGIIQYEDVNPPFGSGFYRTVAQ